MARKFEEYQIHNEVRTYTISNVTLIASVLLSVTTVKMKVNDPRKIFSMVKVK